MLCITNESDLNVDNGAHVVKFGATWCQPCKMMIPTIEKLEKEFPNINFISIDIDEVPTLAQNYKIRTIPTLLVFENGTEKNRILGQSLIGPIRKVFKEIAA